MQVNHRIVERPELSFWREIDDLGLDYEVGQFFCVLNITEDAPDWPYVKRLCEAYAVWSTATNIFSPTEIADAEWVTLNSQGHHGYPMPDDDFGYRGATYDLALHCPTCGI